VLDEPTEGIQPSIIKEIGRAITYLRDTAGMTILLVGQYLDFARGLADKVAIMDRGQIVFSGEAASLDDPDVRRHLLL
jgi:urea transport system ATP-binding protein